MIARDLAVGDIFHHPGYSSLPQKWEVLSLDNGTGQALKVRDVNRPSNVTFTTYTSEVILDRSGSMKFPVESEDVSEVKSVLPEYKFETVISAISPIMDRITIADEKLTLLINLRVSEGWELVSARAITEGLREALFVRWVNE